MDRRLFLRAAALAGLFPSLSARALGESLQRTQRGQPLDEDLRTYRLTILHTNDVHSRIDPFPMDGSKLQGMGGVARRATLIESIRQREERVLLLDAGDMFQGTPYFNYFRGEVELKLMSQLRYDAAAIGNHDFDAGIENLRQQHDAHGRFPLLCANYGLANTPLAGGRVLPYTIFDRAPLRIGVFGLGVKLEGLVPKTLFGETQYQLPLEAAQRAADALHEQGCHYIIGLSHLGHGHDLEIAAQSRRVDLIIGGHTHTFLDQPATVANLDSKPVLVTQAGWGGVLLGCIEVEFERGLRRHHPNGQNLRVGGQN